MSVRWKIFFSSMLLIVVFVGTTGWIFQRALQGWLRDHTQQEMQRQAEVLGLWLARSPDISMQERASVLQEMALRAGLRITLIDEKGVVWADSHRTAQQIRQMENHLQRPEIQEILQKKMGTAIRRSMTLERKMWYLALPYAWEKSTSRPAGRGFLRVAKIQREVEMVVGRLGVALLLATLVGLVLSLLISMGTSHIVSRTLRPIVANARAIARGQGESEEKIADEEGVDIPLHQSFNPMSKTGGLAGSLRYVAQELALTVETLASERDRFAAVLESMNAAVVAVNRECRISWVNRAAYTLLGLKQSPVGKALFEVIPSVELQELVEQAHAGVSCDAEFDLPEPQALRVQARATPLAATGGSVVLLHDITELRRLETIRRDFVANVSHELRTPLSIIRANAETLLDGALEEPEIAREFVGALLNHAERLSLLVNDLLELSRIEANRYPLRSQALSLAPLIRRSIESIQSAAEKKRLMLREELAEGLEAQADKQALEQILLNLIDNAVKYTPTGGKIILRTYAKEEDAMIEVEDDGPGIDAEHRHRIFERFYRIDPGRSRQQGGTGLGLAIVRNLVEVLGGRVGVRPASPHGSIFWVRLPAVALQADSEEDDPFSDEPAEDHDHEDDPQGHSSTDATIERLKKPPTGAAI
ncbi:cell wall metabolism sensor histidine kinase WalK [Myxococcota bacterium]|nr:cell wall metabolism sensor histidine kinase WalK [Myxococcota bacterium]